MAHNERCRDCKQTVRAMLERIYGTVISEHRVHCATLLEEYRDTPFYPALSGIYRSLQHYRNAEDFVRAGYVDVDFYVPEPGFAVEFDESQHFTRPRHIALEAYPPHLKVGYPVHRWKTLCEEIDAHDSDPPYRDEQRAWYDTLRDFLPEIKGFLPTVRLYAGEMAWCDLDPEDPADVERFKDLMAKKSGSLKMVQAVESMNRNRNNDWIATVILKSDRTLQDEKDPKYNDVRIAELKPIISEILAQTKGDGVILFPAGWIHTGFEPAESIYSVIEHEIQPVLNLDDRNVIVCIGVDGRFDRPLADNPFDKDQIAVAIGKAGVVAAARKFHPTNDDERNHITLADSYIKEENGFPRIFNLNGTRYFLFVCYDVYGPRADPKRYPNPDVDVGLNLIHRFCPPNEGPTQENYFPRKGFAGASKTWGIPIFGTGIFYRRDIPSAWPTGIYWKLGEQAHCTYDDIALPMDRSISHIPVPEGHAEVRLFTDIWNSIDAMRVPVRANTEKNPQKPTKNRVNTPQRNKRDEFANALVAFEDGNHFPGGLKRVFCRKDQCRYSFPAWHRIEGTPKKYVCYEFDDWIKFGTPEISVEVHFGLDAFRDIAEIVQAHKLEILGKLTAPARLNWDTSTSGWLRLQYYFPDSEAPETFAHSMAILIEETRGIINDWLKEEGMDHY
ncbi:hypothetical protein [Methanofollis fontis]|uniref:Uncharacterized protein n=1 Tax=Methanofollis fontis TaxID=2052832 RepID=A0A483CWK9_9EURY|nr:hypothetical protein [Methanofollis fontis]TAJ44056.1 hypothetical protein CUJ86_08450 [Methanofollis fontis]